MIQVNRIYLIFNRLVTKKFLVDTSGKYYFITIQQNGTQNLTITGLYQFTNNLPLFYVVILTILHSSYYPVVAPSPVRFSHAKVQRSSGVKHHCANGS